MSGTARPTTSPEARQLLFDALERGDRLAAMSKTIDSPGCLTPAQLTRCFDIVHACGCATEAQATLAMTRQSVDGFLEAVFHDWSSERPGELLRPELEFLVDAEVVAGRMCGMDLPIRTSTLQHQFPYSTLAEQLLTRHVS